MALLTKQQVAHRLGIVQQKKKTEILCQRRGPARLNKWLSVERGKENAFEKRSVSQAGNQPEKEKHIFVNHQKSSIYETTTNDLKIEEQVRFISSWIEHYDVFVLQANGLSEKVNSLDEFEKLMRSSATVSAGEQEVTATLATTPNIDPKEFLTVDYCTFNNFDGFIINPLLTKINVLRLRGEPPSAWEVLLKDIFPKKIKTLALDLTSHLGDTETEALLENVEWIIKHFPALDTLLVPDNSNTKQLLSLIQQRLPKNIKLEIMASYSFDVIMSRKTFFYSSAPQEKLEPRHTITTNELKSAHSFADKTNVRIEGATVTRPLDLSKSSVVSLVLLTLKSDSLVTICNASTLRNLEVWGSHKEKTTYNFKNLASVEKLTLWDVHQELDLSVFPNLRYLQIFTNEKLSNLDLSKCPYLEELHISRCSIKEIDIRKCPLIKILQIPKSLSCKMNGVPPIFHSDYKHRGWLTYPARPTSDSMYNASTTKITTAIYSSEDNERDMTVATSSTVKHLASGGISVSLLAKKLLPASEHRAFFKDGIRFNANINEISFTSTEAKTNPTTITVSELKDKDIQTLTDAANDPASHFAFGLLEGTLKKGKKFPLPASCPLSWDEKSDTPTIHVRCSPADAVKIEYDPVMEIFYIRSQTNDPIKVGYDFIHDPTYDAPLAHPLKTGAVLPEDLKQHIELSLKSHPPLAFLFGNLPLPDKLEQLKAYCSANILNEDYLQEKSSFKRLMAILKSPRETEECNTKIACQFRSQLYMLLSHYLGVPAQICWNETHARVELPCLTPNGKTFFVKKDLGGVDWVDITPPELRKNTLQTTTKATNVTKKSDEIKTATEPSSARLFAPKKIKESTKQYQAIFDELIKPCELHSVAELLLKKTTLAPIINLTAQQSAFAVDAQFVKQLQLRGFNTREKYLYIHNADDLEHHLGSYKIDDKGDRVFVAGPLVHLLTDPSAIVVVNWANFNANEMGTYKSLMDAEPYINTSDEKESIKPIAVKSRIIGLNTQQSNACSAALSRCQPFELAADFFQEFKQEPPQESKRDPIRIDLHRGLNWRDVLFGDIHFKDGKVIPKSGALFKAMQEGRALIIYNPPDDEAFRLLDHRLKIHNQFYLAAEFKTSHSGFSHRVESMAYTEKSNPAALIISGEKEEKRTPIFINANNWYDLFEQDISGVDQKAETIPGRLATDDPTKIVYYLTEAIPLDDMIALNEFYEEKFPGRQKFDFRYAPTVSLEFANQVAPTELAKLIHHQALLPVITLSNDPDFAAEELMKKLEASENKNATEIVYLTPEKDFTDLVFSQEVKGQQLLYQQKAILKALLAGKNVILQGDMSPELYQQLMPLLYGDPPYIACNGSDLPVTGKLFVVMPKNQRTQYPLLQAAEEKIYQLKDYFPDEKQMGTLQQFFYFLDKLPRTGNEPVITKRSIQNMLLALKEEKPLHPHNPIKGLALFNYQKPSEAFFYFNVMGKLFFRPLDDSPSRLAKFEKLTLLSLDDYQKHAFQILNCHHGKWLKTFFSPTIEAKIDFSQTPPTLKPDAIKALYDLTQKWLTEEKFARSAEPEKKLHPVKRSQQLYSLLRRKDTSMILIQGNTGVGKSTEMDKLMKDPDFFVTTQYQEWLQDNSHRPKILYVNRATKKVPGTWDFLTGLSQDKKRIVDEDGTVHVLTDLHKIIFIGDQKAAKHALFRQAADKLVFKLPELNYLETEILNPILRNLPEQKQLHEVFINAFTAAQKLNPTYCYSMRDLSNAAKRFHVHGQKYKTYSRQDALAACCREFSGSIHSISEREKFKEDLMQHVKIDIHEAQRRSIIAYGPKDNRLYTTPEKKYLLDGIHELIDLYQTETKMVDKKGYFKPGILLEGDAGIGKSTLFEAILQERQIPYVKIAVGNKTHAIRDLKRAVAERISVVLEETNLDPEMQTLLEELCRNGQSMIFASQNETSVAGRFITSPTLRNSLHTEYMPNYTHAELAALAKHHRVSDPEEWVTIFESQRQAHPNTVTMRTFFQALKNYSAGTSTLINTPAS